MRKFRLVVLVVLGLMPLLALAGGIALDTSVRYEFTDCASGGSSSQSLVENLYLMRVTDSDVWVCYAATCAAGGERFPVGSVVLITMPRGPTSVSCRSSASTGDVIFTKASN
jgi:hypothetical protein